MHFRDLELMLALTAERPEGGRAQPVAASRAGWRNAMLNLLRRLIARR